MDGGFIESVWLSYTGHDKKRLLNQKYTWILYLANQKTHLVTIRKAVIQPEGVHGDAHLVADTNAGFCALWLVDVRPEVPCCRANDARVASSV